jgi:hypothetical protein
MDSSSPTYQTAQTCVLIFQPLWSLQARQKRLGSDYEVIEEVAAIIKFEQVQEGLDALVSRWRRAVGFYGDSLEK